MHLFISLKNSSIRQKPTADGSAMSNQAAIRFKVQRELPLLDVLLRRGAREVITAAAALPQRPSERSSLQLRAVNSRRKMGKTYAPLNRCRSRMNGHPFFLHPPLLPQKEREQRGLRQEHSRQATYDAKTALDKTQIVLHETSANLRTGTQTWLV